MRGKSTITIGIVPSRLGVLFTDTFTWIRIPNDHWLYGLVSNAQADQVRVRLVHETFRYENSYPILEHSHEITLNWTWTVSMMKIETNQELLIDYCSKILTSVDYFHPEKYNKWNIRLELLSDQRKVTLDDVIISSEKDLANNPLEYFNRTIPFTCRNYTLHHDEHILNLYNNLFKPCDNYQHFFGRYYPLVCTVKETSHTIAGNGHNNLSIQNSFSRFARILMDLNLGKNMMIVKFEKSTDEKFDPLVIKKKLCKEGIMHEGHLYKFFSTSNSGIRGSSAVFVNSTLLNFETLQHLLGKFDKAFQTGGVRKVASRIGLSMGTSFRSLAKFKKNEIFILPKLIEDQYLITDGAGLARCDFFEEVLEKTYAIPYFEMEKLAKDPKMQNSRRLVSDYKQVSALQVRMVGGKGVLQNIPLSLWKELQIKWNFPDSTKVILRNSMIKFETDYYQDIDILNYSSVQGGTISRGVTSCLLEMTDKRQEMETIFFNDLNEYLKEIEENRYDPHYLCNHLLTGTGNTKEGLVKQLIMADHPLTNYFIDHVIRENIKTRLLSFVTDKLSFKIKNPHCVTLMGVVDESMELKEGEVYIHCDNMASCNEFPEIDYVLVFRNPLGYEGDIQKLKIKKNPQSEFLKSRRNVIVFAMSKTTIPLCLMAGGDLDGDLYNIIFHPKIVEYFKQDTKSSLDYTKNDIYYQFQQDFYMENTVDSTSSESPNIIDAHINMFTDSSKIGILSNYTVYLRESTDVKKKQLASKLYADCIDSIKGNAFPSELIEQVKCQAPDWLTYFTERVVKDPKFWNKPNKYSNSTHLVCKMFTFVEKALWEVTKDPETFEIDPDFQLLNPKYAHFHNEWAKHFNTLYQEWGIFWKEFLSNTTENQDSENQSHHKRKLTNKIKEILPQVEETSDQINWREKFNNGLISTDEKLEKAAFFMNYIYSTEDTEKRLKRLQSPFVYSCCLFYLCLYKQFKQAKESGKFPQLLSPKFKVSLKKNLPNITRTTPLEE